MIRLMGHYPHIIYVLTEKIDALYKNMQAFTFRPFNNKYLEPNAVYAR